MTTASSLRKRWVVFAATVGCVLATWLSFAPTASAAPTARAAVTTQRMSGPTLNVRQAGWYPAGAQLGLSCFARGQSVQGYYSPWFPGGWDNLWYRTTDGFWVADIDIDTGSNNPVTGACPARIFNPTGAALWAINHYTDPDGMWLSADCTYFVSKAWWASGLPRTSSWTDGDPNSWSPRNPNGATFNASVADGFKNYVVNNGLATINQVSYSDSTAGGAQLGDVIAYDWDSNGVVDHVAIVINYSGDRPNVAQHTQSGIRPWNISFGGAGLSGRVYLLHEIR